jgi:hypothetical protein
VAILVAVPASAQFGDRHDNSLPDPLPPPLPPPERPEDSPLYEPIVDEPAEEIEWGLDAELMSNLNRKAVMYERYSRQFTCEEVARLADYDQSGQVDKERVKRYDYLLLRDESGSGVREYRQELAKGGKAKPAEVQDEERFPPAYAWVFMFNDFHRSYFSFRLLDTRFDGFDLVHEIQFKGSLRFTSGRDIREWEGKVYVDAFTFTPLEIVAEPSGQRERLQELYRNWSQSFNIIGFRTKPRPFGFRAQIEFRLRRGVDERPDVAEDDREYLTFPTELRYSTNRAISPNQLVAVKASTRSYERYRFVNVTSEPQIGDTVRE